MSAGPIRVVKIGGSLLDFDGLADSWNRWFASQQEMATVIIAGGGSLADLVRRWDEQYQLSEETAHWMCVKAMSLTAALVHHQLAGTQMVDEWQDLTEQLGTADVKEPLVFSVESFLRLVEPVLAGCPLPHSWEATSDSIAARVAEVLSAEELVLCKSVDVAPEIDWTPRAAEGLIDRHFPEMASKVRSICWVNLRNTSPVS